MLEMGVRYGIVMLEMGVRYDIVMLEMGVRYDRLKRCDGFGMLGLGTC